MKNYFHSLNILKIKRRNRYFTFIIRFKKGTTYKQPELRDLEIWQNHSRVGISKPQTFQFVAKNYTKMHK